MRFLIYILLLTISLYSSDFITIETNEHGGLIQTSGSNLTYPTANPHQTSISSSECSGITVPNYYIYYPEESYRIDNDYVEIVRDETHPDNPSYRYIDFYRYNTNVCSFECGLTYEMCVQQTGNEDVIVKECTCCEENYPPEDMFSIKHYSGSNADDECADDKSQFPDTDSTCWKPKCSTDQDVTLYVSQDYATHEGDHNGDGIPNKCDPEYPAFEDLDCNGDGIPNETDSDDTASGSGTSEPTPEEQAQQECEAQKQTFKDYGYWIAVHSTLEIGYTNEYNFGYARKIAEYPDCDFDVFEVISCPKMYKYDLNQDKCVKADDSKSSDENCASTYVKTDFLDFSNVGYDYRMNEPYNLESFKCYIEYSCSIDYKIKKFDEVSCTSDTTDMSNVVEMEIKPSETNSSQMTADFTSSSSGLTLEQKSFNELKKVNSNLERMIDSINNMDTLASAVDGGSKVSTMDFDSDTNPSYNGNSVADLEQSLSDFGSLGDDFTKFGDNLMNDISTVGESFSNAENLFINGNLALTHITEPVTCPHTLQHEGFTYEVDLCETVSPYSNVIYTFIYMLGFFSILITFSYIFVLKGVD